MNIGSLKQALANGGPNELQIRLESDRSVAVHFHITEVGKVSKDFVDCGGVRRSFEKCVLQTYVANDIEHRLAPSKFLGILEKASILNIADETEVEIEVQGKTIETYAVAGVSAEDGKLTIQANSIQTACLAPDTCGLPVASSQTGSCCGTQGDCC